MTARSEERDPADSAARRAALEITRSFIVQAPAGSGKTELLIQRCLALLARVQRPETIVAMTFTRKAAGEIRERIIKALREAQASAMPEEAHRAHTWRLARAVLERDAALGWELVAHPARLQVHTIDALCATWMRQAPMTVRLGFMPRLIERAEALHVQAARAELDAAGERNIAWQRLLDYLDNDGDRLITLVAEMLARRDQWLRHVLGGDAAALRVQLEQTLGAEVAHRLEAVVSLLPAHEIPALLDLGRYAASNLEQSDPEHPLAAWMKLGTLPVPRAEFLDHWRAIADWLLTKKGDFYADITVAQGFPRRGDLRDAGAAERDARKQAMTGLLQRLAAVPGLVEALHGVRRLPVPRYDETAWAFIEALLEVLPRAAARLQLVFAEARAIDFIEASQIALRALGEPDAPSDLLLRLDMRIEHLLVDEFQDTSLAQYELIERLVAGWTPGDGRTLFVVGDPMQSIFGFREAEVGLYLDAQRRGCLGGVALERLALKCNFRAQCELVGWVNRVYAQVLASPRARTDPLVFGAATPVLPAGPPPAVTVEACTGYADEAARVVRYVRAALAGGAAEVAVLVRKRGDLAEILPALRAADIRFAAVDLDRMTDRQIILDLASLTHALIQPDDRLAWLSVLRAPWCGLSLADLFALDAAAGSRSLCEAVVAHQAAEHVSPGVSAEGGCQLRRLASAIAPGVADRGRQPLAAAVRGTWLALGGPACLAEPSDLDAAERFFGLLAEHAPGADVADWNAFLDALTATFVETGTGAGAPVRVMTLHRAKGLEFDVVILPGLAEAPGSGPSQLLRWRRRAGGLLLAPIAARHVDIADRDPVYAYLDKLANAEEADELVRLLYVGCTRARKRLHLTAVLAPEQGDDGRLRWRKPSSNTALAKLWPAIEADLAAPESPAIGNTRPAAATGVPLLRLPLVWRSPPLPTRLPIPTRAIGAEQTLVEFDWVRETARQIGLVAHRLLRQCADEGLERWSVERVAAQRARVARELAALGFTGTEADAAADQVLAAITRTLADARGRWLFDARHTDAHSEYALTGVRAGAPVHVVLDRSFVDASGIRWIVDFKLSQHEGAGREAFLDSEQARYRAQLEDYAEVMLGLGAQPIRLGLYFPVLGGWREWEAPV
jgi:ATP-dependent exoDNAse (exonuclease V) beta subunit